MAATNHKILIVEDDRTLLELLNLKFNLAGYSVSNAQNGEEGLNLALTLHPDLILLDIIMPIMDGMTMLQKLRSDPWGQNVPVMILTNLTDANKISNALAQGVYDFLVKSDWKLDELVNKVNERLNAP